MSDSQQLSASTSATSGLIDAAADQSDGTVASVPMAQQPLIGNGASDTVIREQAIVETDSSSSNVPDIQTPLSAEELARLFPPNGTGDENAAAGIKLAHFRIVRRLGAGGMGAVFLAEDLDLSRLVALKILNPSLARNESMVARFRIEGRSAAQMGHDHVARVFFAGRQHGLHFICFEYTPGETLRELIERKVRLSPAEAVSIAAQMTVGLHHMAAAGIVHRDIKPSNVLVTREGQIKIADFGLARREEPDSVGELTNPGATLGTFDYIAPEQARDPRSADLLSDLYSLGCTMYQMLTGKPPYPEGTPLQKMLDHHAKEPPTVLSVVPDTPPELSALVTRLMQSERAARYQSCTDLLHDLTCIAGGLGLEALPVEGAILKPAVKPPEVPRQRRPSGIVIAVVLLCATAVTVGLLESRHDQQLWPEPNPLSSTGQASGRSAIPTPPEELKAIRANEASDGSETELIAADNPGRNATGDAASGNSESAPANDGTATSSRGDSPGTSDSGTGTVENSGTSDSVTDAAASIVKGDFELQSSGTPARTFRSLSAALSAAVSGDVIVLKYNGSRVELPPEAPIRLSGRRITIRGGSEFRPTIVFQQSGETPGSSRHLITLMNASSLTITNVDLQLRASAPGELLPIEGIIGIIGPNKLRLTGVTMDLANPEKHPVSFVDLQDADKFLPRPGDVPAPGIVDLEVSDCAFRGSATAFRFAGQTRSTIRIANSGFALFGYFVDSVGSDTMTMDRGRIELNMNHVTCLTSDSIIHMRDSASLDGGDPQRMLPELNVRSENCVFAAASPTVPFVLLEGNTLPSELEELLTWTGDINLYGQFDSMWQVISGSLGGPQSMTRDFSAWVAFWMSEPTGDERGAAVPEYGDPLWQSDVWQADLVDGRPEDVMARSFALNDTLFELGHLSRASDGTLPGAQALREFPIQHSGPPTSALRIIPDSAIDGNAVGPEFPE